MTRKDYVRFAAMLKDKRLNGYPITMAHVDHVAGWVADTFEQDNPLFKRARFLKACGVDS